MVEKMSPQKKGPHKKSSSFIELYEYSACRECSLINTAQLKPSHQALFQKPFFNCLTKLNPHSKSEHSLTRIDVNKICSFHCKLFYIKEILSCTHTVSQLYVQSVNKNNSLHFTS